MDFSKYIACICEGTAEQVIINILLDNNKLFLTEKIYSKKMYLEVVVVKNLNSNI